eukprot:9292885-Pyramimonas_sp.AAC.1
MSIKTEKRDFSIFSFLSPEAYPLCSEQRGVRTELYQGPGGNLVDGLSPVSSCALCMTNDAPASVFCEVFSVPRIVPRRALRRTL